MAQTSVRRDQENQAKGERFERASVMWTDRMNSHTGPAACEPPQQRPDTWQHPIQRRSCPKILLAPEGASTHALRALGGPQHGRDKAALAIEHHDRLEPVFVIVGIEQPQLLAAVHGVEGVVDVEHDPPRHLPEGRAVQVTIARPMRSRDRTSGKFSRREMVGCDTAPGPTARGRAPS